MNVRHCRTGSVGGRQAAHRLARHGATRPRERPAWAKGRGGDPAFAADRDLFHDLLEHRADIRRDVKKTDQGVETLDRIR